MFKFLVVLFSLLAVSHAQQFGWGPCPNIPAVANFSAASFTGKWYQQYKYLSSFDGTLKCLLAEFKLTNGTLSVINTAQTMPNGTETKANGTLTMTSNNTADFVFNKLTSTILTPSDYKIIGTDYTSYFVLYSCQNYFFFHFKYASIYTRDRFITPLNGQSLDKANAIFDLYGLDRKNTTLLPVDQISCGLFW